MELESNNIDFSSTGSTENNFRDTLYQLLRSLLVIRLIGIFDDMKINTTSYTVVDCQLKITRIIKLYMFDL